MNMDATSNHTSATQRRAIILIVDDDPIVTRSLDAFLSLESDYEIITLQSPVEALERLRHAPVDLVITDFLMPEMNGHQFLLEVTKLYPDVPRIMLTGYADKENTIRAINEVGLFQYIEKPWENEHFLLVIDNAITTKSLKEALTERIHELDEVLQDRGRLRERDSLLNKELLQAQKLQLGMLPESLPRANGITITAEYQPALEIGGDFYDVVPRHDDQVAVLVADTTGHGIQAALSTAIVKFAFSQLAHGAASPTEIVRGMNKILCKGLPRDTFAAAIVAVLDMTRGYCRLANAGLPHPYRVRRGGGDVDQVFSGGFILGVLDGDLYPRAEEVSIQLDRGDTLLLYTDGLSEVENESGEQFDAARLREVLLQNAHITGRELFTTLVGSSRDFGKTNHKWDDITILGIERK